MLYIYSGQNEVGMSLCYIYIYSGQNEAGMSLCYIYIYIVDRMRRE